MAGRLFDLPYELRLSLFEHVLSGRKVIRIGRDHLETGLLLVSKRIRSEMIQYMRNNLTFEFENSDDLVVLARRLPQGGRTGSQRKLPYSRPYIAKVRVVMDFTIHRADDRHPLGADPFLAMFPQREVAPIDPRDITFFIGNNRIPWQYYIGTRFHEQYRLMVNLLAHRANDHNIEIDSGLLFMRRNWDWIFSTWQQCGFQDAKQVTLQLRNLEFWVGHMHIHDVSFEWRPVVDFFRLLMLAPPSIATLNVDGPGSLFLRIILNNLHISLPVNWMQDNITPEVAIRMEELYRVGKLGIRHSTNPWFKRLEDRVKVRFLVPEGHYHGLEN